MHNPIVPAVELTLCGRKYQLHYEHRDFATAEYLLKQQGYPISLFGVGGKAFWDDLSRVVELPEDLREAGGPKEIPEFDQFKIAVLLYVGIIRQNPKLTFPEAQDLITWENFGEAAVAVFNAAIMPLMKFSQAREAKREAEKKPEASEIADPSQASGTGSTPGPSLASNSESQSENSGA